MDLWSYHLFLKLLQLLVSSCSWWLFTEISVTPLDPEDEEHGATFKSVPFLVLRNWWKTGLQIFFFSSLSLVLLFFKNIRHKTQLRFCTIHKTKISSIQFNSRWVFCFHSKTSTSILCDSNWKSEYDLRKWKLTKVDSPSLKVEGGASGLPTRRYSCITQSVLEPLGGFPV